MEMHQIRYFLAVCDKRSFTLAAQLAYVSQPSLTHAIGKLEKELGGALFIRDRSGCRLTALGHVIEPRLRRSYQDALTAKAEAIRFTRLNKIPLRIGLMTTIGAQRLSPFFARYKREYPATDMELIVDTETALLEQVHSGRIDLVISAPPKPPGKPFLATPLYEERYVVVFSNTHPFAQLETVNLHAIQSESYLDRLNCEMRETLKSLCDDRDLDLYAAYRSNSEEWILQMVRAGMGFALAPEYSLLCNADDITFRYLADLDISRQVYAIYLAHEPQNCEVRKFVSRLERGV